MWTICGRRPWSDSVPDYQLLIFDWDGTLVDSIGRIVESMRRAADELAQVFQKQGAEACSD